MSQISTRLKIFYTYFHQNQIKNENCGQELILAKNSYLSDQAAFQRIQQSFNKVCWYNAEPKYIYL